MIDLAKIQQFAASGGETTETAVGFYMVGALQSKEEYDYWTSLQIADDHVIASVKVTETESELPPTEYSAAEQLRISIQKKPFVRARFYFLASHATEVFKARNIEFDALYVCDLTASQAFATRGFSVQPWHPDTVYQEPAAGNASVASMVFPQKFVRDYVPGRELTETLEAWSLLSPPDEPSPLYEQWAVLAVRRLMGGLANVISLDGDAIEFQCSNPGIYKIPVSQVQDAKYLDSLNAAVDWVYFAGSDVEARHILFTSEMARFGCVYDDFLALTNGCLDSARASYNAHVQSSSRDTIKAMADLRKAVIDEAQKASQKAQELTSGLWRETAIFVTPFTLKMFAGQSGSHLFAAASFIITAILVVVSMVLQNIANEKYFSVQEASRAKWISSISMYFNEQERKDIAHAPLDGLRENYLLVRKIVFFIYSVYVIILLLCAAGELFMNHAVDTSKLIYVGL